MIIAVDFDNTLALGNKSHIELLEPNYRLIERLNKCNAYIKIVTARGAKYGLSEDAKRQLYLIPIMNWLDKYGVMYDEISFNKEYAELYIDDMTILPDEHFDFYTSKYTKNKILITENTVIKSCKSVLYESEWYKLAKYERLDVPNVLFANNDCIITERIHGSKPLPRDIEIITNKFAKIRSYSDAGWETYVNNLPDSHYKPLIARLNLKPTFFHGDLSTTNILKSVNGTYLIDPNYKGIFGNYQTDLAKAVFSYVVFEKDSASALKLSNDPLIWLLAIAEGQRVEKYDVDIDFTEVIRIYESLSAI